MDLNLNTLLASFASAFTQEHRLLTLSLGEGQIAAEQMLPQSLEGTEGVSQSYRYLLTCLSPSDGIELKALLGQAARIGIKDANGAEVIRCGIVSSAERLGADGGFAQYRIAVEAPFSLLHHRRTARVFQDMPVSEIVRQIISEHQTANPVFARVQSLAFETAELPVRSYCVQYKESDFDFIVRLLHSEGLAWRFMHLDDDGPKVKLVVFDDAHNLPQAAVGRVRFHRADASEKEDGLTAWASQRQVMSGQTALASFDYKPVATLHAAQDSAQQSGQSGQALQSTLQNYDAPGIYFAGDEQKLNHYAKLRQQALDLQSKQFSGSGTVRGLLPGEYFRLDDHPAHEADAAAQREFVVTQQTLRANNNLGADLTQQLRQAAPRLVLEPTDNAPPFQTTFQAQRRGIPLTPPYAHTEHAAHTSLGPQTGTVVGPKDCREVYTDEFGRIKVQLHWQRAAEHPTIGANMDERSSCWLRVTMPSAGAGFGHMHLPRVGQEVLVNFIEGNIDRPVVTGVLYNGSHMPPQFSGAGSLPGNKTLSGIKSKEHDGQGYNELLFDDTPQQVRARLASTHGATQLNQGFLTHPRSDGKAEPRGEGFELRTDQHGAIRAANGLLLSTEAQNGAGGKQLAREHASSQLQSALALSQVLAETATAQQADAMETGPEEIDADNCKGRQRPIGHLQHQLDALQAWEAGSNTDTDGKMANGNQSGQQPLLVLSAPAGMASVSAQSQTLAAGTNLDLIAQRDLNQTSGRRWLANVGKHISLFVAGVADQVTMKLIAAKGKVQVQAQEGEMELTASKDVAITSTKGRITVTGKEEILLTCGGAYIRLKGGNIELHCPGKISIKGSSHEMSGPASVSMPMPFLPKGYQRSYILQDEKTGEPLVGKAYRLKLANGRTLSGYTDWQGKTSAAFTPNAQPVKLEAPKPPVEQDYTLYGYGTGQAQRGLQLKDNNGEDA
ncbi:type VI secretion system Vgr family protein [Chromobacterium violaceum]|uniref:type VI secretion system Vgr family protein n=1 Tax=Chromobacterium violaceum TaxID=536 RepID=UPI001B32741B|nr:type VI secretion system tip protein TssI/VgrG [Chromobacterium violaceum]MBP4046413.1 type VI secretion system tip protein VgrG [Chromobacterium violaceum]